jgi:hypothetical protein
MMTCFDTKDDVLDAMEHNGWEVSENETQGRGPEGGEWMPIADASAAFYAWHRDNYEPPEDPEPWSGGIADNY